MRNLFIYEVIRYYPNIRGDEFFNIGIRLSDSNKAAKIEFIQEDHLKHIHRFPSIEKKVITSMLEQLKASEHSLQSWYGNYLKISAEKIYRSHESFEDVMHNLYEDFIGYKFHKKENVDPIEQIKEQTKLLVSSEFEGYLSIEKDDVFDFVIYNKNRVRHFSDLGRLSNKVHVNRMLWQREEYSLSNLNDEKVFDFLNISHDIPEVAHNLLTKNEIAIVPYDNDNVRYEYLRELVK